MRRDDFDIVRAPFGEGVTDLIPAKIAADGSSVTEIAIQALSPLDEDTFADLILEFELGGGHVASRNVQVALKVTSTTMLRTAQRSRSTHTRLWSSHLLPTPEVTLRISLEDEELGEYPIQIYRTPVLLVHGLWGNLDTWEGLESRLDDSLRWDSVLTKRALYPSTNSFTMNRYRLRSEIEGLLGRVLNQGFSAGKVDVVGHSMGGILARLHVQSPAYAEVYDSVNRLVTVNTPHSGSQMANLLKDENFSGSRSSGGTRHRRTCNR